MYKEYVRPLSESENRFLKIEEARLKRLTLRVLGIKNISITLFVSFLAGLGFSFFANYPWHWGVLFGLLCGSLLLASSGFDIYKAYRKYLKVASKAVDVNVKEIESARFIEFQEFEDLGVMYCFEVEPNKYFILNGQEYYETPKFPCLHFEIISIKDILYTIRPKSVKREPDRIVSADVSKNLGFFQTEVFVSGDFESIENNIKSLSRKQS